MPCCYALMLLCAAAIESASPAILPNTPVGAFMKISISYKHVDAHQTAEAAASRSIRKLTPLLKSYAPDLVQLHGVFSRNPHNDDHSFSLNLSLPTGTLHATGTGENVRTACKH